MVETLSPKTSAGKQLTSSEKAAALAGGSTCPCASRMRPHGPELGRACISPPGMGIQEKVHEGSSQNLAFLYLWKCGVILQITRGVEHGNIRGTWEVLRKIGEYWRLSTWLPPLLNYFCKPTF